MPLFKFFELFPEIVIVDLYIYGPMILAIGLNCFYWKDLATHVRTTAMKTTEDELNKKKLKSLYVLLTKTWFKKKSDKYLNWIIAGKKPYRFTLENETLLILHNECIQHFENLIFE